MTYRVTVEIGSQPKPYVACLWKSIGADAWSLTEVLNRGIGFPTGQDAKRFAEAVLRTRGLSVFVENHRLAPYGFNVFATDAAQ